MSHAVITSILGTLLVTHGQGDVPCDTNFGAACASSESPSLLQLGSQRSDSFQSMDAEVEARGELEFLRTVIHLEEALDVPYDTESYNKMDIFYHGKGSRPAILLVHGSGGDKAKMGLLVGDFSGLGYVVSSINYKGASDVGKAIKFLKANAGKYGIDKDKLGVYGYSAGGRAAATKALDPKSGEEVKAAIIVAGGTNSGVKQIHANAPPFLLITAADDPVVNPAGSMNMHAQFQKLGCTSELLVFKTGGHSPQKKENQKEFLTRCAQFWETHLGAPAEPVLLEDAVSV
eukprot:CAMPEP_0170606458 /NCGR_PEP_ID=MMETSP0224-20130122/20524_1 /TAXON_ID=285029 /ORGANISM="Togula jolla, Strain CCCM 725" /LENGTH=288 /DNA_ID=CAMNT_0010931543 /DNA_START=57 /DNA_END=923 /DNA_ORIENTATION=+